MKKILPLIFVIIFSLSTVELFASCKRVAKVKYQQKYGWSKLYTVNVTFMTGLELNRATSSYKYSSSSVYGIIFWDNDQASVIKLTTFLLCGLEVTCECIDNSLYDLKGYDQDDDLWNICLSAYCF